MKNQVFESNKGASVSKKRRCSKRSENEAKIKKQKLMVEVKCNEDTSQEATGTITKSKWKNKTRVLVFSSRGISFLQRKLMKDIRSLMPHSKPETKLEKGVGHFVINEMCDMKNCNKCIFFESKRKSDLYMWVSNVPQGPSMKFLVENILTMSDFKLTGNCLKGSRPLLSFDKNFETLPQWMALKELFIQVFGVPNYHPKSKPFVDHVMSFSIADDRIWIRNYQIIEENGELAEIGPRFTLNPIKIFDGSFCGETLFGNSKFVTPSAVRIMHKREKKCRYEGRIAAKIDKDSRKPDYSVLEDEVNKIFEEN